MATVKEIEKDIQEAKANFQHGEYSKAAQLFKAALDYYLACGDALTAAEMANNQSVALLKAGDAQSALSVLEGTDQVFEAAGDQKRLGMAFGNQAAALEAIGKLSEAENLYEKSADALDLAGEKELKAYALQSLSALKLRKRDQFGALITMQSALSSKKKLSAPEMVLKRLLRTVTGLLNR